jgi:hypothetical protein
MGAFTVIFNNLLANSRYKIEGFCESLSNIASPFAFREFTTKDNSA